MGEVVPFVLHDSRHKRRLVMPINNLIDLSSPCRLPADETEFKLEVHRGEGIVTRECRGDDIYIDGVKLGLFFSEKQNGGKVVGGYDLRTELEERGGNVGAKVLDHLVEHNIWPNSWKKDAQGNRIYVFFWNDIFHYLASGRLFVRYGYWGSSGNGSDMVMTHHHCLDDKWDGHGPAASLLPPSKLVLCA